MKFKLRFPKADIPRWAGRYDDAQDESFVGPIRASVKHRGHLERDESLAFCRWKTPRSQPRCARNKPEEMEAVTRFALAPATPDRMKIQVLTLLSGVGWPSVSIILHLFDAEPFPILDYRALWSLMQDVPSQYTYDFWREYTRLTRGLARQVGCDMRQKTIMVKELNQY